MKKLIILILAVTPVLYFSACKKKYTTDNVTEKVVEPHFPEITLSSPQYISIGVGGSLPTISASAYDSVTNEVCELFPIDASGLDNTTPGMYPVAIKSINGDGYISSKNVFVAVTDIPDSINLAGTYARSNGVPVEVIEIANGLYSLDNFFGAATTPGSYAYFVQVDDSTMAMPAQPTDYGTLFTADHALSTVPADTFFQFSIQGGNITSNTAIRKFMKQ